MSLFWESVIAGLTSGKRLAKVCLKPGIRVRFFLLSCSRARPVWLTRANNLLYGSNRVKASREHPFCGGLVQLVEQAAVNRWVGGSSPSTTASGAWRNW